MKILKLVLCASFLLLFSGGVYAQALKINVPLALVGTPNLGAEFTIGQQFSINGDVLWTPYMFKKDQSVFRVLVGSADFRYYVKPKYYYTNDMYDGFYLGPYAMYGLYNIGINKGGDIDTNRRNKGWGVSAGISLGYKMYLSKRLRLDFNLGVGYAHLQYDTYLLGGVNSTFPIERKGTKSYVGPTKFGVHLVYNIFK